VKNAYETYALALWDEAEEVLEDEADEETSRARPPIRITPLSFR
jgi:hypothetical protein